jgi:hypothetical protein
MKRATTIGIAGAALITFLSAMIANAAIVLDSRKQLFLDDYLIASMAHVKRTIEPAQKFPGNPVLWPTESWELAKAIVYGSVIRSISLSATTRNVRSLPFSGSAISIHRFSSSWRKNSWVRS